LLGGESGHFQSHGGQTTRVRSAGAEGDSRRCREARLRGQEHLRPPRPQRRPRQGLGRPDGDEGRRDGRRRDRAARQVREHGRPAREGSGQQDVDVAGDGTTAATVLAEAIFKEGLRAITAGHDPNGSIAGSRPRCARSSTRCRSCPPGQGSTQGQRGRRPHRHDLRQQRSHDRRDHGGLLREGRQGRRDHGRGGQEPRHDRRRGRGHAVRPRLSEPAFRDRRRQHGSQSSRRRSCSSSRTRSAA
jgi:hypothetical protein